MTHKPSPESNPYAGGVKASPHQSSSFNWGFDIAAGHWMHSVLAGLLIGAVATAMRYASNDWMAARQPFVIAYAAVAVATWVGTWRAGAAAAAVCFLVGRRFIQPDPFIDLVGTGFFFAVITVIILLGCRSRTIVHAVQEAERRKSELLALVAHEMQTPLAAIGLAAEVLRDPTAKGEKKQAVLMLLERHANRLRDTVSELMDVARVEQRTVALEREPIEMCAALRRAAEDAQGFASARSQSIEVHCAAGQSLAVHADSRRLAQILGNLLHNACKFSPTGSTVLVHAERGGREVVVRVTDAGEGIPPENLKRVFEPFIQLATGGKGPGGLGLGLTLTKRLVELHGGSIAAFSRGRGTGTQFVVRLPALDQSTVLTAQPA